MPVDFIRCVFPWLSFYTHTIETYDWWKYLPNDWINMMCMYVIQFYKYLSLFFFSLFTFEKTKWMMKGKWKKSSVTFNSQFSNETEKLMEKLLLNVRLSSLFIQIFRPKNDQDKIDNRTQLMVFFRFASFFFNPCPSFWLVRIQCIFIPNNIDDPVSITIFR